MDPLALKLRVRFFCSDTGNEPVREWLKEQPFDLRKAIGEDIKTVQYGWPIGMPIVRKLDNGLWEVRTTFSHGIARVLFTVEESSMVLLHAFIKKSEKTPKSDLATAKQRKSLL